jgi:MFS family permease
MNQKLWTREFITITITNLFIFLAFYILLVSLPVYAMKDLNGNETEAGLLVTLFLFAAIIIRPFSGKWIESKGKKTMLLSSLLILMGASILYFFTDSITAILFIRCLHGVGFGIATTVCGAIVADLIPETRKGEGMGYFVMSANLAMVIGPFLGLTAIQHWGNGTMFLLGAILSFVALMAGLSIKLPEIKRVQPNRRFRLKDLFEVSALRISFIAGLFGIFYSSILSFVSIYANEIGLLEVSSFFFVVYAIVLLITRPFTGRWFDRFGANAIIYPCILFFAIGMFLLSKTETSLMFLMSAALIGLGWGTLFPSFQTIAIKDAPPERRGIATATFLSLFDLGIGLGSFIIGMISINMNFSSLYFYSSLFVLLGIIVFHLLYGRNHMVLFNRSTSN